jgi:hypothetical protein
MVSGLVYIYSFLMLFEEKRIPQRQKDFCIPLIALAYSLAMLTSSVFGYVFDVLMGE